MPVPKRRTSRTVRNMRRAHDHLKAANSSKCPNCGRSKLPHHVCLHCGHYRGVEVIPNR
ncbi:MAG: 50S ribosomal protein L32 [Deltaproteobacteria bacterium GWA2_50_8]|nr:MAG: 50S ribosomal protein L32 [Deltaproteobacteria bacterium GWA2_50_8]